MIIDNITTTISANGLFTITIGTSTNIYINTIECSVQYFLSALKSHPNKGKLNENDLTLILVEQVDNYLVSKNYSFGAKNQYSDTFLKTKGIPDFYFHSRELGFTSPAYFVVESKRLPSQTFKTEYVFGKTKNGGIERFKIEKHGLGFDECGMIGFVEEETYAHWFSNINTWIEDLSKTTSTWKLSEKLNKVQNSSSDYQYLESEVIRSSNIMKLHHIWIDIVKSI